MAHRGCSCVAVTPQWNRRNFLSTMAAASISAMLLGSCSSDVQHPAAPTGDAAPGSNPKPDTLFRNVRVLDVRAGRLGQPTDVLIRGNTIAAIGTGQPVTDSVAVIDGGGRTLMPGLIDNHVHLMFSSTTLDALEDPSHDMDYYAKGALAGAEAMLMRGFTAVRDMGGPIFPLKRAIDAGKAKGPRVWPSGAMISQTSGHGDFRTPSEPSRRFSGKEPRAEQLGATFIVDGRDEVLTATRENLRFGASQIKLMAGGGASTMYDPLDVTQFTLDEMRAAVDAASDWNTYVTVHAYTPKSVRRAVDAGITCIEHGQLLDQETVDLLAAKGIWLSGQYLSSVDDGKTPPSVLAKRKIVYEGNERVWPMAKKAGVKLAWGTDFLFNPDENKRQNGMLLALGEWFDTAETLRLATHDNAQLLAFSGPRTPYEGTLGVVEPGALADLLLVKGDPLADIKIIADPDANFDVIMKDGVLYKNR